MNQSADFSAKILNTAHSNSSKAEEKPESIKLVILQILPKKVQKQNF